MSEQTTNSILMIRPVRFTFNPETAETCTFQQDDEKSQSSETQIAAQKEFDDFVVILRNYGVNIIVVEDTPEPHKPDSIFPNNWVSFHEDGTVVRYPIMAKNRRPERRHDIIEQLATQFRASSVFNLTTNEKQGLFLEGTGSMVLDRHNKIAFACLSPRTHIEVLSKFAKGMRYSFVAFEAHNQNGVPIYHTNVVMSIGEKFAIVCFEAIPRQYYPDILANLEQHEIIEITMEQVNHFAGNMLQIKNSNDKKFIVMSEQAYLSLIPEQITTLSKHGEIIHVPLYTIERYGGGSARCMLAEIFLPKL